MKRLIVTTSLVWVVVITGLHLWLNLDINWLQLSAVNGAERKFKIGFLPVT